MQKVKGVCLALLALLLLVFLSAGCSTKAKGEKFVADKNTKPVQSLNGNINNSKKKKSLELYVLKDKQGVPVSVNLVADGYIKAKLGMEDGVYTLADMSLIDMDGDKKDEVLIYRYGIGGVMVQGLNVYKPANGQWQEIFSVPNPVDKGKDRYQMKYIGNYQVSFEDKQTGLKTNIPLNKERYQGNENKLEGISTWVDPIFQYEISNPNGDGTRGITTNQRVMGVSQADTIALLKTNYALKKGKYQPRAIQLYSDNNQKKLAEKEI